MKLWKNTIGDGTKVTKILFAEMVGSDLVEIKEVWEVIHHAMSTRKRKRGYKRVINENIPGSSGEALVQIIEAICSVGYGEFLRKSYKK